MAFGRDWGQEAQTAAEAHLAACQEAMFAWEDGDESVESPAMTTFCGCDTCVVREVLYAGWPFVEQCVRADAVSALERILQLPDVPAQVRAIASEGLADQVGSEQHEHP